MDRVLAGFFAFYPISLQKYKKLLNYANILHFFQKTILKILDNEKYTGDTLWQKTYSEFMGKKFKPNLGQAAKYYIEGSHEAIISKETFALANEIKKKAAPKSFEKNNTPFRKKLYCGRCGHTYAFINSKRRPYWQCGCRYAIDKPDADRHEAGKDKRQIAPVGLER